MKKLILFFMFFNLILLSGCLQTTAFLGPGVTVISTGNVFHAGLQYGASTAIKNETGKYPLIHIKDSVEDTNNQKKLRVDIINFIEDKYKSTKKKLSLN